MKIAVITGASSGMGKWFAICAKMYFPDIDEVWIIGRNIKRLKRVASHISIPSRIFSVDLTTNDSKKILLDTLKEIKPDIRLLVNSAGLGYMGRFDIMEENDALEMISINCQALTAMIYECLPYMQKDSRIINLASAAAFIPQPEFAVYAATKSYVLSLSDALAKEFKPKHIYVTSVCPGCVDTHFFDKATKYRDIKAFKKLFMANEKVIVHHAFWDSKRKRTRSVYGFFINMFYILCKLLPLKLILYFI